MNSWITNDFKCLNTNCELYNQTVIDILYKRNEVPLCSCCSTTLTKQITANWSQGRHPSVSAWRVNLGN